MVATMSMLLMLYFIFLILSVVFAIGNWIPVIPPLFLLLILTCTTATTPLQLAWSKRRAYGSIVKFHLFNILFAIIIYALIYYKNGLALGGKEVEISFLNAFNFSCTTWTTLGYGNFEPTEALLIITSLEALHGVFAMAIFIGVIAMWMNDSVKGCDEYVSNLSVAEPKVMEEIGIDENEIKK